MRKFLLVLPFIVWPFSAGASTVRSCMLARGHGAQQLAAFSLRRNGLFSGGRGVAAAVAAEGGPGSWTLGGTFWSLAAGAAGRGCAGDHLCLSFRGKPVYVMPLVFGGAPVVNTFVTMVTSRSFRRASAIFYVGVLLVAVGAAGVLFFKPGEKSIDIADLKVREFVGVILSIVVAASVGHVRADVASRADEDGRQPPPAVSLRGPGVLRHGRARAPGRAGNLGRAGKLVGDRMLWSLAGGAAGAIGALGIILAFNFGGRPIYVMPLVFGGAPVVNTLITILRRGSWAGVSAASSTSASRWPSWARLPCWCLPRNPNTLTRFPAKSDPAAVSKNAPS